MTSFRGRFVGRVAAVVLASIFQAVWLALFARLIGPDDFGKFSIAFGLMMVAGAVSGFGFHGYLLRLPPSQPSASGAISAAFVARCVTIAVAVVAPTASALAFWGELSPVLIVALLAGAVEMMSDFTQGALAGRKRLRAAAAALLGQRLMPLVAVLGAGVGLDLDTILPASLGLSFVISLLPIVNLMGRPLGILGVIRDARYYWGSTVVSNITQLEPAVIGWVSGAATAGYYGVALRVFGPISLVTNALITVAVPELASAATREQAQGLFRRLRRATLLLAVIVIALSYPATLLVLAVLGPGYESAAPFITSFIVAAGLSGISRSYQSMMFATDQAGRAAVAILSGSSIGLLAILAIGSVVPSGLVVIPLLVQGTILLLMHVLLRLDPPAR